MTIDSSLSRIRYVGNGVTTNFSIPFAYLTNNDGTAQLAVYIGDSDTPLIEKDDYTIEGIKGSQVGEAAFEDKFDSGTVIFKTAPEQGVVIAVIRNVPQTQSIVFIEGSKFPAQDFENGLDKLTMEVQEVKENLQRAIVLPPTSTEKPIEIRNEILVVSKQAQETAENAVKMVNNAAATIQNELEKAKDNVVQYVEETVKPDISDFADTAMAGYAQEAFDSATIATQKANEALQSFENANNSANIANEAKSDVEAFVVEAKGYAEEAKQAAEGSGKATITYWDDVDA